MNDNQREKQINLLYKKLTSSKDNAVKKVLNAEMNTLIKGRSPRQVRKMEQARGLR